MFVPSLLIIIISLCLKCGADGVATTVEKNPVASQRSTYAIPNELRVLQTKTLIIVAIIDKSPKVFSGSHSSIEAKGRDYFIIGPTNTWKDDSFPKEIKVFSKPLDDGTRIKLAKNIVKDEYNFMSRGWDLDGFKKIRAKIKFSDGTSQRAKVVIQVVY
uniref:Uncharacterized protein n=1 Tax=Corethron hystrix TaxID=216773 RepID=A0A7S1B5Q1_9STRA